MLKSLRKSVLPHDAVDDLAPAGVPGNAYVQTALLKCPGTVERLRAFWEPAKLFGFSAKGGLKQVVADAGYSNGTQALVPHHVLVELSEGTLAHDQRTGGHLGSAMARTLADLHQTDFADHLPAGTQASYRVVAAPDVAAGTVRVRLGAAIHVPQPDDAPAWQVQLSRDGADWTAVPAVMLQSRQRLFILSGSADHGSQVCPEWPFDPHVGLVMLNLPEEPELDLSAEPLRSLEIIRHAQASLVVVRRPGTGADEPCLYLRATRLQAVRQSAPAALNADASTPTITLTPRQPAAPVNGTTPVMRTEPTLAPSAPASVEDADTVDDAPTLMWGMPLPAPADDNGDDAPTLVGVPAVRTARLVLHGLALQRPSMFAAAGVQGVRWGLDAQGCVVQPDVASALLRFELTTEDELRLHTRSGPRVLAAGEALPLRGCEAVVQWQPLPAPMSDACIGWLSLPPVTEAAITLGRSLVVGRQAEALKALRPLSAPGHLVAQPQVGGDRMGLSRQHAELRLTDGGLAVCAIGQATLIHLDAGMQPLGTITSDRPALLADGQHLVLGHYIWRFTA